MRILWIGKGASGGGGDEVYDRKLLQRLGRSHDVARFVPQPVGRAAKLANLAAGVPLYRASYRSAANDAALRAAIARHDPDVVAISWEPFDFLAASIDRPTVLLLHNITSDAVVEVFGGAVAARLYARRIRGWERRLYARPTIAGLVTLSLHDAAIARAIAPTKSVTVIAPGAPPLAPPPAPELRRELLVSGTYDWYPKRRDLTLVARELAAGSPPPLRLCWDNPPPAAAARLLVGEAVDQAGWPPALRFGLVPDSFASGFKLKVTSYIANNCIVLSRSDVAGDYAGLPGQELFIRRIGAMVEIDGIVRDYASYDPADLARRFEAFKQACAERFSWDASAMRLGGLLEAAAPRT